VGTRLFHTLITDEQQLAFARNFGERENARGGTQPGFVYVHKWTVHDLVMWDTAP
jgi:hypothetical protein